MMRGNVATEVNVWVPTSLVNAPNFANLEPSDLGFDRWKSCRIHRQNIILLYWTIQCRMQRDSKFVSISSRHLQKRGGRFYARYLDWLIKNEFIETKRQYWPGESSRKYRTLLSGEFTPFALSDPKRLRRVVKPNELTELERLTFDQLHTLQFDRQIAVEAFETLKNSAKPGANHSIIEFTLKDFRPYESAKTVLISSAVTNLNRALRCALTWNGSPIYQVDICNSQPLCLAALAGCPKFLETAQLGTVYESIQERIGLDDRDLAKQAFLTYAFGPISNRQPSLQGRTRDELSSAVNVAEEQLERRRQSYRRKKLRAPSDQELAKVIVDRAVQSELRARMEAYFRCEFPLVAARLDELKAGKKGSYRNAARQLQKLEADCLLRHCFQPLAAKGIPVLTVHDSVLTTAKHAEEVAEFIKAQFSAAISQKSNRTITVSVKKSKWQEQRKVRSTGENLEAGTRKERGDLCCAF